MQELPAAPRNSAGHAPPRRHNSIRRTSTIDTVWPTGRGGTLQMTGRARDAVTARAGEAPQICAEDEFRAEVQWDRTIVAIEATPSRAAMAMLAGARGGGHLRKILDDVVPGERQSATPLYLLLDDISGASLVAGWAWSRWTDQWRTHPAGGVSSFVPRNMEGICTGFRPGSAALSEEGTPRPQQNFSNVPDLRNPADPDGWHEFTDQPGVVGMRRARRIDVWVDDIIHIDSAFQDSATNPKGGRAAIHEYRLIATADTKTLKLLTIKAEPRVLPYAECPAAVANVGRMAGVALPELRQRVLDELKGTSGCTHLNDALRALAEVPALVGRLRQSQSLTA